MLLLRLLSSRSLTKKPQRNVHAITRRRPVDCGISHGSISSFCLLYLLAFEMRARFGMKSRVGK